jgi:hypothetical protein
MRNKIAILFIIAFGVTTLSMKNALFNALPLPTNYSTLFAGSGNCENCHTKGSKAFQSTTGNDYSPIITWRSSMMANANRDPLWRAKVSAEVDANPAIQAVIEDKCNTCHSPMGRTEAVYHGATGFSFADAKKDTLSKDGASCTVCHQIRDNNLGTKSSFTGKYVIDNSHQIFGPYENPVTMPMYNFTGYTATHSNHITQSELCATCHTLYTPYLDNQGQIAGEFPEQTPYLEWKNSNYPSQNQECQTCHLPAIDEGMVISNLPPWLSTLRQPIYSHDLVGGNSFMNQILKNNADAIGLTADEKELDTTYSKTLRMLQNQSIELNATSSWQDANKILVEVEIINKTGHKFPTGFPSRQAWIHLKVEDENQNTVFESGMWNRSGELENVDAGFEPHYAEITKEDQVQIYQSVMGDVDDQPTYTLLRGAKYLKDNRIPPKGFVSTSADYADVEIFGDALSDPDFNKNSGVEGSGSDKVIYKVPVTDNSKSYKILAEVRYQTISKKFKDDLFNYSNPDVDSFKKYYDNADKTPVLIKSQDFTLYPVGINDKIDQGFFEVYPSPFSGNTTISCELQKRANLRLDVYNNNGQIVKTISEGKYNKGEHQFQWNGKSNEQNQLPDGVYYVALKVDDYIFLKKVLLME